MNGELAQVVTLVAHARASLALGRPFLVSSSSSTFQFVGDLDFEREVPRLFRDPAYRSVGKEPIDWYRYLVRTGARVIRLVRARATGDLPDHHAVAFSNGGEWAIAVDHGKRKALWRARWMVGEPPAREDRIWSVLYREIAATRFPEQQESVSLAARNLALVLADAADFARDAELDFWLDWFESAQAKLEADRPSFEYHPDMLPADSFTGESRRLLAASERAWVFGGMGSWNDLGFEGSGLQQRYDTITPRLYEAVIQGIVAATNGAFD